MVFSRNFFVVYFLWQVSSCSVSYLTLKSASAQKQPTDSTQLSNALLNNIAVRTRDGNACSVLCTMQDFHCFDPILKASIFVLCYTILPLHQKQVKCLSIVEYYNGRPYYTQFPFIRNALIRNNAEISGNFKKPAFKGSNLRNTLKWLRNTQHSQFLN